MLITNIYKKVDGSDRLECKIIYVFEEFFLYQNEFKEYVEPTEIMKNKKHIKFNSLINWLLYIWSHFSNVFYRTFIQELIDLSLRHQLTEAIKKRPTTYEISQ